MLRSLLLAAALVPLTAAGCASSSPAQTSQAAVTADSSAPVTVQMPEQVPMTQGLDADGNPVAGHGLDAGARIGLGETVQLHGQSVTFVGVVEDSRCPQGTTCMWEGRARVTVRVGDSVTVTLATPSVRTQESETVVTVDGTEILLQGVYPYPGSPEAEAGEPVEIGVTARDKGE